MTADEVAEEIKLAMRTIRNLPLQKIGRLKAMWPEVMRSEREQWWAYGSEPTRVMRVPASTTDIDRLDKVLSWLWPLDDNERVVVSARGAGKSWRWIMRTLRSLGDPGQHHEKHRRLYRRALAKLAAKVSQDSFKRNQHLVAGG